MRVGFILLIVLFCIHQGAQAEEINIALVDDTVDITTTFSGAELTLFGAVSSPEFVKDDYNLVAVLEGPRQQFSVREVTKRGLFWLPSQSQYIDNAPGFYFAGADTDFAKFVTLPDQARYHIGINNIDFSTPVGESGIDATTPYAAAFLTEMEERGFYREDKTSIQFVNGPLFTVRTALPATTPIGSYTLNVFLLKNSIIIASDSAVVNVRKVGLERRIYDFAHERPIIYGVICVIVSLLAGWITGFAFRK